MNIFQTIQGYLPAALIAMGAALLIAPKWLRIIFACGLIAAGINLLIGTSQ